MYGVCVAIGIVFVVLYVWVLERRMPALAGDLELCVACGGVGALIGAKMLYLLTVLPEFWADLSSSSVWDALTAYLSGGFVFYGGLYGGLLGALLYVKRSHLSTDTMLHLLLPIIPLFHSVGRIGCFCAGCCYGIPSAAFGICYSESPFAPNHTPLFPIQPVESILLFLLFALLLYLQKKRIGGWRMLGCYLLIYGTCRFLLEFLRGDAIRGILWGLSTSQYISVPTALIGGILLIRNRKKAAGNGCDARR